jgi:hypothetical protein
MGNATTFPVQSLFFLAVALGSLAYVREKRVTTRLIRGLGSSEVRVFGDDIIVPDDCAGATISALTALGLKVNADKTFTTGRFRESCGVDAYGGEDVTTVSVLDAPMQGSPGSVVSSVDVHNNLCNKGYLWTAAFIQKTARCAGFNLIPHITHGSGSFGWYPNYISEPVALKTRWNRDLQVRESRCMAVKPVVRVHPSEGGAALLQYFTEVAEEVTSGFSTLHYMTQRAQTKLRLSWVALGPRPA